MDAFNLFSTQHLSIEYVLGVQL